MAVIHILAPFAPFMAEELWHQAGHEASVHTQGWPEFNPDLAQAELVVIPVQVNGKVRGELQIEADQLDDLTQKEAVRQAKQLDSVNKWLVDKDSQPLDSLKREIYVPGQIVSLVT
jgi:leucyl-tRNA synthetase